MEKYLGERLNRLEDQLAGVNKSLQLLARIDERMLTHMQEQQRLSVRIEKAERRLDVLEISRAKFLGAVAALATVGSIFGGLLQRLFFG
jgi:hypothetical protein